MRWDHSGIPLLFDLHLLSLLPCSCWKTVWKITFFSLTKSFNLEHHIFVWIHSCCLAAFLIVLCSNNFIFISKSVLLISSTRYCYSRHLAMQIQWIIYSARWWLPFQIFVRCLQKIQMRTKLSYDISCRIIIKLPKHL